MNCFECDRLIDDKDVESGRCFKHDRYKSKPTPLCKLCRKPFKMNSLKSDQDLRDLRKDMENCAYYD